MWFTYSLYLYSSNTSLAVEKANLKLSLMVSATFVNAFLSLDSSSVKKPNTIIIIQFNTRKAIICVAIERCWCCVCMCVRKRDR